MCKRINNNVFSFYQMVNSSTSYKELSESKIVYKKTKWLNTLKRGVYDIT